MATTATKLAGLPSQDDLRRTFETALETIQHPNKPRSQTPIVVRKPTAETGGQASEKRALTDAARALAHLWKISPSLVR